MIINQEAQGSTMAHKTYWLTPSFFGAQNLFEEWSCALKKWLTVETIQY
jgi:hypothetical protein